MLSTGGESSVQVPRLASGKTTDMKSRLYLIAAVILLVGLGSSIMIYMTAENNSDTVLSYEDSKMYMHDLELYGGKTNVLMNDLRHWFVGLWHGESLAFTVAYMTIFISFLLFLLARHMSSRS
jgi:hypothetical protein